MGEIERKSRKLRTLEAVLKDELRLKEDKERDGLPTQNNEEAIEKMKKKIEDQKEREKKRG